MIVVCGLIALEGLHEVYVEQINFVKYLDVW